jgi:N6-adenosine-specific RNA methylase IME4
MTQPFDQLPKNHFGAILADPPWDWRSWGRSRGLTNGNTVTSREVCRHYDLMDASTIGALPVADLCAKDAVLFMWATWPLLPEAMQVVGDWGFEYKTCAFDWTKADNTQPNFFEAEVSVQVGMGYWTRSNTEPCLLGTRGKPKRVNADVRQAIIAPRREHSRKPDGIHERIERLVAGPYLELFARQQRPGWTVWGNQTDKFAPVEYDADDDIRKSVQEGFRAVKERVAAGGPGWPRDDS